MFYIYINLYFKKFIRFFLKEKNTFIVINYLQDNKFKNFSIFSNILFLDSNYFYIFDNQKIIDKIIKITPNIKFYSLVSEVSLIILMNYLKVKKNSNHYDYPNAKYGFSYYVRCILSRKKIWPSYDNLFPHLLSQKIGNKIIHIDKLEFLNEDINSSFINLLKKNHREEMIFIKNTKLNNYYGDDLLERVNNLNKKYQ